MDFPHDFAQPAPGDLGRRQFLSRFGMGFGSVALAAMAADQRLANASESSPLAQQATHFAAKAKRVIHVFCNGGPSHVDTWDPKPALSKWEGKTIPALGATPLPSPFKFTRRGESGIEVSELFPKLSAHVDKLAVLRAVHTDSPEHKSATLMMTTGSARLPKPSLGSWVLYGLGTENQNLPGYISIGSGGFGGNKCWGSSFLPSMYQGTNLRKIASEVERMIENIRNPEFDLAQQRTELDLVQALNQHHFQRSNQEANLDAEIQSLELAFRMQSEATSAFDISGESQSVVKSYGNSEFGKTLLVARRLAESGVRFVQVFHGTWDHHVAINKNLKTISRECDQPLAALLADLQRLGMLEDTLVVWGGEFGRTPGYDKRGRGEPGRDHHSDCFSMWMAGGGVKPGLVYGETDEFGAAGLSGRVHVHDLHATVLHLLGFDHEKLTYRYNGRDFRLTDVYGNVVQDIIA
tara:strand:+ start:604164 stop:605558 length:1395 start_codon:yes stop_codon:yes gene_type:complete